MMMTPELGDVWRDPDGVDWYIRLHRCSAADCPYGDKEKTPAKGGISNVQDLPPESALMYRAAAAKDAT